MTPPISDPSGRQSPPQSPRSAARDLYLDDQVAIDEICFRIDAAIRTSDLPAVYELVAELATLPIPALELQLVRLQQHFGRDLKIRDLRRAIKASATTPRRSTERPVVLTTNRPLRDVAGDALAALRASNEPPELFVRAGQAVHVVNELYREPNSDNHRLRPVIKGVEADYLRGRLTRIADFYRSTEAGDKHIVPPTEVIRDLLSLPPGDLDLPVLAGLVEIPTLRSDGTVVSKPGFDQQSGMFYSPADGLIVPDIPDRPTADDLDGAVAAIDDIICDFPFVDEASRANFFGLLLTPIIRPILDSCVPLAVIDAPAAGTGKSLLADIASLIATGRPASMMPLPRADEEMEKRIGASLQAGRPLIVFDNVEGDLRAAPLALALTAREYETRILGQSENMLVPNQSTWIATGNNIRPAGDMPRRCYQIRIDAQSDRPYQGRKFRHDDLRDYVLEQRGALLSALLTICRAWFSGGKKRHVVDPLGSFEQWNQTVGSILHTCGVEGFLSNLDLFQRDSDEDSNESEAFLSILFDEFSDGTEFLASELVSRLSGRDDLRKLLPTALVSALERKPESFARAVGRWLVKVRDRQFGAQRLKVERVRPENHSKSTRHRGVSLWRVIDKSFVMSK